MLASAKPAVQQGVFVLPAGRRLGEGHRRDDDEPSRAGGSLGPAGFGFSETVGPSCEGHVVSPRPRHPVTELEALLRSLEAQDRRVGKGRKYFKAYCSCGLHKKTVHLTPSVVGYLRNLVGWLRRETCWKEDVP